MIGRKERHSVFQLTEQLTLRYLYGWCSPWNISFGAKYPNASFGTYIVDI